MPPALFANAHLLLNTLPLLLSLRTNTPFFARGLKLCKTLRLIIIPMQFDNEYFEKWLDDQAAKAMDKITNGEQYQQIDVMLLVLKAQTNHIAHLEQERHGEMRALHGNMDKRFSKVDERFDKVDEHLKKIDEHLERVDKHLDKLDKQIERMDMRIEQVDKKIEQMDKRMDAFEQRAEAADKRFYNFMIWSFSSTLLVGGLVIAAIEMLK